MIPPGGCRKGGDPDDALSEVIGFVLILGVITIFIAIWMTYAVPLQGREAEIQHMSDVKDWFTGYKFSLDSLWINNMEYDRTGVILSSSLNLGTLGGNTEATGPFVPLMQPIGSTGFVSIRQGSSEKLSITTDRSGPADIAFGSLEYSGDNNYWIPQTYYYQMGGVFLSQTDGTVCIITPEVSVYRFNQTTIGLRITPTLLTASGGTEFSGSSNVRVDSRYRTPVSWNLDGSYSWVKLVFTLRDAPSARAWQAVLNETRFTQNVPLTNCDISRLGNQVTMNVTTDPSITTINMRVYSANYTVSIQPTGSVIS